jgi:hypothetical protein
MIDEENVDLDLIDELYDKNFEMTYETKERVIKDHYMFIIEEIVCMLNQQKGKIFYFSWLYLGQPISTCFLESYMYDMSLCELEVCICKSNINGHIETKSFLNLDKLAKIAEMYNELFASRDASKFGKFIFGLDF